MPQTAFSSARSAYLKELKPRSLPASLITGLVMGLLEMFFALSFASLIFHGDLAASLPVGAGLALVTSAVMMIVIGLTSSQSGTFSVIQDVPTVLLAVMTAQAAAMINPAAALPTVLTMLAFASLLTGGALIIIGQLKLGGLIRYLPYPVIGGFLAATGWLLVTGSLSMVISTPLNLAEMSHIFQPSELILWLPGLIIAAVFFLVLRFATHPLALPGVLIGTIAAYYLVMILTGTTFDHATTMGIFSSNLTHLSWSPPLLSNLITADWSVILRQAGNMAVLIGMTFIGLLLNVSAIELVKGHDYDLNHELRAAGFANLISGLAGGYIGYHMLGNTSIANRVGVRDRVAPVFGGLVCLAVVFFNLPILDFIPKALFSGLLLSIGLDFLYDWVITGWNRFSRAEYLIELLILIVIVTTDFLTGVAVGLVAMVVLFVISYSRVKVILHNYTVGEVFSTVTRSQEDSLRLIDQGHAALVYELQGFLFFGTANVLLDTIKNQLREQNSDKPAYLLIDFHQVTGIDSSAALSFHKTWQLVKEHDMQVVLSGASKQVWDRLSLDQIAKRFDLQLLPDLDHGLEWCEEQILARHHPQQLESSEVEISLVCNANQVDLSNSVAARTSPEVVYPPGAIDPRVSTLITAGLSEAMAKRAAGLVTPLELGAGEVLIRKGAPSDVLYFVVSGQVTIYRETENGLRRARTLGPGSTIGEIGLFIHEPRTAAVHTDQPTRLLCMNRLAIERIQEEDPRLAAALQELIIRQLALRLRQDERGLWILRD